MTFRSAVTGQWVTKAFAALFPRETVKEAEPTFTRKELLYISNMLDAMTGSTRNVELRAKLLAKIDGMLG